MSPFPKKVECSFKNVKNFQQSVLNVTWSFRKHSNVWIWIFVIGVQLLIIVLIKVESCCCCYNIIYCCENSDAFFSGFFDEKYKRTATIWNRNLLYHYICLSRLAYLMYKTKQLIFTYPKLVNVHHGFNQH